MYHFKLLLVFAYIGFYAIYSNAWNYNLYETQKSQEIHRVQCRDSIFNTDSEENVWKFSSHEYSLYGDSDKSICWNTSANNLVIRKCDSLTGMWIPEAVDCSVPPQSKNAFCPEDLIEIPLRDKSKYICVKISEHPQKFEEHFCYGSDTLVDSDSLTTDETEALMKFFHQQQVSSFWMPVKRARNNEFNPFVVMLPGTQWGDVYDVTLNMKDLLSGKHCLANIINNDHLTWRTNMTHCDQFRHSVCVFREDFIALSGCPQGFGALCYKPNECFGIEWKSGLFPFDLRPVSIAEYFQKRNSLKMIFEKIDMHPEWYFSVENFKDNTGNYVVEMNAKEQFRIVTSVDSKPGLSSEVLSNRKDVEMILRIDVDLKKLVLTVYNRNYIWSIGDNDNNYGIKCFTNADYEEWKTVRIKMIWENDLQTKTMFELKLSGDGPGYYWCEAHTVFDFSLVTSAKVVANRQRKGHVFAMIFHITCEKNDCLNINKNMKNLSKRVRKLLNECKNNRNQRRKFEDLIIHNVRIMDIESVASDLSRISCLCHVTVSLRSSSVDNSSEQNSEEQDSEEDSNGIRHDTFVRMQLHDLLTNLVSQKYPDLAESVRSTEFCFPQSFPMDNGEVNQWLLAKHSETATTSKLCLQSNGLPVMRKCCGNFMQGAYWEYLHNYQINCITEVNQNIITRSLFDLDNLRISKKSPEKAVKDIKNLLENSISNLIPADFYYMAKIIQNTIKSLFSTHSKSYGLEAVPTPDITKQVDNTTETTSDIVRIYNYLMEVNDNIIKPSTVLNSTNMLLDAFENLIDRISMVGDNMERQNYNNTPISIDTRAISGQIQKSGGIIEESDKFIDTIDYGDVGVVVKIASNFVIFAIRPKVANLSGIALFSKTEESDEEGELPELGTLRGAFKNEFYRFLLANTTVDDLLYEPNLQLATYVPETLWERLDEISKFANHTSNVRPEARIVIKIYSNDKLFQEDIDLTDKMVWGKVVSVSIPGHDKDLPEMLPLVLRVKTDPKNDSTDQSCSYWNYNAWVNDGLTFLGRSELYNDIILCGSTHLTPFAYLIGGNYNLSVDSEVEVITKTHKDALDIITLLGCSLSLFGIVCIFITAATFQSWRKKASSKVLLQLSTAIALQMVLFCFVNTEENAHHLLQNEIFSSCIAIGACLHYSVLVQFSWMIIIAYLQFKRYVQVFGNTRPKRFFIKSTLVGWGLPLIPVLIVLLFDRKSYIPNENSASICYPSGLSLYFGIVMPILIVIIANFIIFMLIVYNILRGPTGSIRHTEKRIAISQVRLSVLLFFLLGFTWIFGLLTTMKAGLLFSYLFCLTATLQGFVLFIYFIVLDPVTRRLWGGYFKRIFGLKTNYDSSTSMKETTQTL